ncbi:MAG: hypothetical protein KME31_09165 [Tolypothrix carrinoi HA7290-LM1]|nr:hypothetical protein [Tolypothrix carrinoi HA7290-LM1]
MNKYDSFHAQCPMTADARLPGNPSNAQPNLCPMTADARLPGNPSNAQPNLCPIPHYPLPITHSPFPSP